MIEVIHEHSVDMNLLPKKATILDLGCRGFQFGNYFRKLGHIVHEVDMDDGLYGSYDQCAITNYTGFCGIIHTSDPQGTKIGPGHLIPCYTLEDYMKLKGVEFLDVIKMDVEGAEVDIIASLTKAPSKQLSIEWHRHCGQPLKDIADSLYKLTELGYKTIKHEFTNEHGAGLNAWDSLFILQEKGWDTSTASGRFNFMMGNTR